MRAVHRTIIESPRRWAAILMTVATLGASHADATTVTPLTTLNVGPVAGQRAPAVTWDAANSVYVIAWEDERTPANGVDLYAARILANGTVHASDSNGCALVSGANAAGDETMPRLVTTSANPVVVWVEARTGFQDIFAARVVNCSAGTEVQVTSGIDIELVPDVSFGNSNVLVAYQVGVNGGGQEVRVRRYTPQLAAVDASPITLAASGAGRVASLGAGPIHFVAWEAAGDIFLRSVADSGAIGGTALTVSSAARAQTRPRLGLLPGSNALVAWQDDRVAGDTDIWARRFTSTPTAIGASTRLNGALNEQLAPAIAGDGARAMAVWQDRRNSTITAQIYGTRIDPTTGAPLDGDGFVVLAPPGNAFEPTVAKGPAADYLVAGVLFGATPRIYYRIVRDEPPAGTLTPNGTPTGNADGIDTADLTFTNAVGASGLAVIDGTTYDVTLSSPGASLFQPDVDTTRPGHQLVAVDGEVRAFVQSTVVGSITVNVSSVEGTATGVGTVMMTNGAPSVSSVLITPDPPGAGDDLVLGYVFTDVNGDPEMGTTIQWTRNGQVITAVANQNTVPAGLTSAGESWRARVTPSDGTQFGTAMFSNTVTVQNRPPTVTNARIDPPMARTGLPMSLVYTYEDLDGDAELGTTIRWTRDGVLQSVNNDQTFVPGSSVVKGQVWVATIRPRDGSVFGTPVMVTKDVVNTPPRADAGDDVAIVEGAMHVLDGSRSDDVDPGDTLQFQWSQVRTGAEPDVMLSDTSAVGPSFVAPSINEETRLTFGLVVTDGEDVSTRDLVVVNVTPRPDSDNDGVDDEDERAAGTNPDDDDTDQDGLSDGDEIRFNTDPLDADTDDDGLRDGDEPTFARNRDRDGDGVFDGTELSVTTQVAGGGAAPFFFKGTDVTAGAFRADVDPTTSTDPNVADTDRDTFDDGIEDANKNGALDPGESDPNDPRDPGTTCSDGVPCPAGLVCMGGVCLPEFQPDAGVSCEPLTSVECCVGGCTTGQFIAAICEAGANIESCPSGADLCVAGACSDRKIVEEPAGTSGCGCDASGGRSSSSAGWLMVVLALALHVTSLRRRTTTVCPRGSCCTARLQHVAQQPPAGSPVRSGFISEPDGNAKER